jgi:hypothetical protein
MRTLSRRLTVALTGAFLMLLTATGVAVADGDAGVKRPNVNKAVAACPAGTLCIYEHRDFGGTVLLVSPGTVHSNLRLLSCPGCRSSKNSGSNGTWGDMLSSWINNTSVSYCWFWDANFGGRLMPMTSGVAEPYVGSTANDQASSIAPC